MTKEALTSPLRDTKTHSNPIKPDLYAQLSLGGVNRLPDSLRARALAEAQKRQEDKEIVQRNRTMLVDHTDIVPMRNVKSLVMPTEKIEGKEYPSVGLFFYADRRTGEIVAHDTEAGTPPPDEITSAPKNIKLLLRLAQAAPKWQDGGVVSKTPGSWERTNHIVSIKGYSSGGNESNQSAVKLNGLIDERARRNLDASVEAFNNTPQDHSAKIADGMFRFLPEG